ncbi:MAG: FHA domain-containing protein [Elusimicrobia bacterium]|nr:FHA domain-containing protein [Elusimicrobiota bacterium]
MIQLAIEPPLYFQWNPQPPQWQLRGIMTGRRTARVCNVPFVIGRALDCQLVLPDSAQLRKTTSRWHCYIQEKGGRYWIADGSFDVIPETGVKKPSVSGTLRNGSLVKEPQELAPGDTISLGPWNFKVEVEEAKNFRVDIDDALRVTQAGKRATIKAKDLASGAGYKQLHELFLELNKLENIEECLARALAFAAEKIPAAEVSAILLNRRGEAPSARLAWRKNQGRVVDLKFSPSLLEKLSVKEPFFLSARLSNPSSGQNLQNITSALLTPLSGGGSRLGVLYMDNRGDKTAFTEEDLYLASALSGVISLQLMAERQLFLGRLEDNLRQYFSSNVARRLAAEARAGKPPQLEAAEKTAAILFVDIQGFTNFCHAHKPREISGLLNPYFKLMSECIHRHGGYVDKFIGDGVMGVFQQAEAGQSPGDACAPALQAVRSARNIIQAWRANSTSGWGRPMPLRIGIDAGRVVIGNIGFPGRLEYTAIGDAVNIAARLQKLAPPDGIALSAAGRGLVEKEFRCEQLGVRELKGFGDIEVWLVSD